MSTSETPSTDSPTTTFVYPSSFMKSHNQHGLEKQRSAPSSFLQQILDTINENDIVEDNKSCSSGGGCGQGEWEEALLFSALLNDPKESRSGLLHVSDDYSSILRQRSSPAAFIRDAEESSNGNSSVLCSSPSFMARENKRKHGQGMSWPDLVHHFGPSERENLMQFHNETTACQLRAKRGCATHPRSIAERNRRTRINRNMKKLQDVCPNMNKQTNQADMLELAAEYIKELKNQVQILSDMDAKCACSSKHSEHHTIA